MIMFCPWCEHYNTMKAHPKAKCEWRDNEACCVPTELLEWALREGCRCKECEETH